MRIIASGLIATTSMTAFIYLIAWIWNKQVKVIHILGTMLTNETTTARNISNNRVSVLTHIAAVLGLIVNFLLFENFLQGMLRRGVHAKIV